MPCCGQGRKFKLQDSHGHPGMVRIERAVLSATLYRYTGRTRLTARGARTRNVYQFDGPGATAIIDGRDVPSLVGIPGLVRV